MFNITKTYEFSQKGFEKATDKDTFFSKKTLDLLVIGVVSAVGIGVAFSMPLSYVGIKGFAMLGIPVKAVYVNKGVLLISGKLLNNVIHYYM